MPSWRESVFTRGLQELSRVERVLTLNAFVILRIKPSIPRYQ